MLRCVVVFSSKRYVFRGGAVGFEGLVSGMVDREGVPPKSSGIIGKPCFGVVRGFPECAVFLRCGYDIGREGVPRGLPASHGPTPSLAIPASQASAAKRQRPEARGQVQPAKRPSGQVHMTADQRFSNADPAAKGNGQRATSRKV